MKTKDVVEFSIVSFFALLTLLPFLKHYKVNDNHLNWLNHDYGKNLLMTTEPYSVMMTEGGDNQVFASAYFQMVENRRPDVYVYDQKGNVFKRIYGDLRFILPDILDKRRDLVDTKIITGNEPFYDRPLEARDDPIFVPYDRKRPVYMTWKRPQIWKLGDYYFKQYGILYKVQPIRYKIVDDLVDRRVMTFNEIGNLLAGQLRRSVDMKFVKKQVQMLVKEGLVRVEGNRVFFLKDYPKPYKGDYWSNYVFRWKDVPNAIYWDYLSREIVANYDYMWGNYYRDKALEYKREMNAVKDPKIRRKIERKYRQSLKEAEKRYEEALKFGYDMTAVYHNIASVYYIYLNKPKRAVEILEKALDKNPFSYATARLLLEVMMRISRQVPAWEETKWLDKMDRWVKKIYQSMMYYSVVREKGLSAHSDYKYIKQFEEYVKRAKKNTRRDIENLKKMAEKAKTSKEKSAFLFQAARKLQLRAFPDDLNEAGKLIKESIKYNPRNRDAYIIGVSIYWTLRNLNELKSITRSFYAVYPDDPIAMYYRGKVLEVSGDIRGAMMLYKKFLDFVSNNPDLMLKMKDMVEDVRRSYDRLKGMVRR